MENEKIWVSKNLSFEEQWITGLLTVRYGLTKVDNSEVAKEIMSFIKGELGIFKLITISESEEYKKNLEELRSEWEKMR